MIHILQCLCGPMRHAIMGILYDDADLAPEDARRGLEAIVESSVANHLLNRRCEMCDKDVKEFWYDDGISKEQDMVKAKYMTKLLEDEQRAAQIIVKAQRKAERN